MSTFREGRWLCRSCGQECLGRHEKCESCGSAREAGVRFYLPENSPIVTDPSLVADALAGVDWNCDHCDGANKGSYKGQKVVRCGHCGNARDNADKNDKVRRLYDTPSSGQQAQQVEREEKLTETRARRNSRDANGSRRDGQRPPRPPAPDTGYPTDKQDFGQPTDMREFGQPSRKQVVERDRFEQRYAQSYGRSVASTKPSGSFWLISSAAIFVAFVVGFLVWSTAIARYDVSYTVTSQHWERSIDIEEYRTLSDSGWSFPSDAYHIRTETRLSHHETIVTGTERYSCGTTDMGNGYFRDETCTRNITIQKPVFANYYHYKIDRWVFDRAVKSEGVEKERFWPKMPILFVDERKGSSREHLWFILANETESRKWTVNETEWSTIFVGSRMETVTDWWGRIVSYEIKR